MENADITELFSGVAGGASIVGLLWLIVTSFGRLRKGMFVARSISEWEIPSWDWAPATTIRVGKVGVPKLVRERLLISNRTGDVVRSNEIVNLTKIQYDSNGVIYAAKATRGEGLADCDLKIEDNAVVLLPSFMRSGEGIIIDVLSSMPSSGMPEVVVKGFGETRTIEPRMKMFIHRVHIIAISAILGLAFFFVWNIWISPEIGGAFPDLSVPTQQFELFLIMLLSFSIVFSVLFYLDYLDIIVGWYFYPAEVHFFTSTGEISKGGKIRRMN